MKVPLHRLSTERLPKANGGTVMSIPSFSWRFAGGNPIIGLCKGRRKACKKCQITRKQNFFFSLVTFSRPMVKVCFQGLFTLPL